MLRNSVPGSDSCANNQRLPSSKAVLKSPTTGQEGQIRCQVGILGLLLDDQSDEQGCAEKSNSSNRRVECRGKMVRYPESEEYGQGALERRGRGLSRKYVTGKGGVAGNT